jgi:hypothetical protein
MIALRTVTRHRSAVRSFMSLSGPSVSKLTVNVNFVDEDVSKNFRETTLC